MVALRRQRPRRYRPSARTYTAGAPSASVLQGTHETITEGWSVGTKEGCVIIRAAETPRGSTDARLAGNPRADFRSLRRPGTAARFNADMLNKLALETAAAVGWSQLFTTASFTAGWLATTRSKHSSLRAQAEELVLSCLACNEHGPAERLTAPGSRAGFAERDARRP